MCVCGCVCVCAGGRDIKEEIEKDGREKQSEREGRNVGEISKLGKKEGIRDSRDTDGVNILYS